jgi:hypothetical protein
MDDDRDLLNELEDLVAAERALDLVLFFLESFWAASEEVTVGLAA